MANPNPSPRTRIGAPNGPKPGKTTETARLEVRNAEAAMRIRARILAAAEARLVECSTDDVLAKYVETAMLKLLTAKPVASERLCNLWTIPALTVA